MTDTTIIITQDDIDKVNDLIIRLSQYTYENRHDPDVKVDWATDAERDALNLLRNLIRIKIL